MSALNNAFVAVFLMMVLPFIAACSGGGSSSDGGDVLRKTEMFDDGANNGNAIGVVKPLDRSRVLVDESTGIEYVSDQLLITFAQDTPRSEVESIVEEIGGTIVGYLRGFDDYQIELPNLHALSELMNIADRLEQDPRVVVAAPNTVVTAPVSVPPNDDWGEKSNEWCKKILEKIFNEWCEKIWEETPKGNNWGWENIRAVSAWNKIHNHRSTGNRVSTIPVGVMEMGGFSNDNDDVRFRGLSSVQHLAGLIETETGIKPGRECNGAGDPPKVEKINCQIIDDEPEKIERVVAEVDDCDKGDHGMHVAGIIGATPNNRKGIAGVAWDSELWGFRVEQGYDVKAGILWLASKGVRVINMSFGNYLRHKGEGEDACKLVNEEMWKDLSGKYAQLWISFLKRLKDDHGVDLLLVKAAGNENVPAIYSGGVAAIPEDERKELNVLVVGALAYTTDYKYEKASISNYGKGYVDIFAPGENIYSAIDNDRFDFWKGTSMAAPFVAGVAASVLSVKPCLTANELRKLLLDSAVKDVVEYRGERYPALDMDAAIGAALSHDKVCEENDGDFREEADRELNSLKPVTIQVLDQEGRGVESATIAIEREKADGTGVELVTTVETGRGGEATLLLEPGIYTFVATSSRCRASDRTNEARLSYPLEPGSPSNPEGPVLTFQKCDSNTISGYVFDSTERKGIGGAMIHLQVSKVLSHGGLLETVELPLRSVRSDDWGSYVIGVPGDIDHALVSVTAEGYVVDSFEFSSKDFYHKKNIKRDIFLRPLNDGTDVVVEEGWQIYHLGNDRFSGSINSRFQREAMGDRVKLKFRVTEQQLTGADTLYLHFKHKGVQSHRSPIFINEERIGYLPLSNYDGSYRKERLEVPLDRLELMITEPNFLTFMTTPPWDYLDDIDDIEISTIHIELGK